MRTLSHTRARVSMVDDTIMLFLDLSLPLRNHPHHFLYRATPASSVALHPPRPNRPGHGRADVHASKEPAGSSLVPALPTVKGSAMIAGLREAMKQPVERRLAAILAADVAGYSRLMGADEEGTHERLRAHLREL